MPDFRLFSASRLAKTAPTGENQLFAGLGGPGPQNHEFGVTFRSVSENPENHGEKSDSGHEKLGVTSLSWK